MSNFQDIDIIFGTDCPLCALNMKRLWCEFTCNPNQADFVQAKDQVKVTISKVEYDALEIDLHMSLNTSCNIYTSCHKIPEITQMSASAMGFMQFQGDHAVEHGNTLINLVFHEDVRNGYKPLTYDVYPCSMQTNGTVHGYSNVTQCPCKLYF